MTLTPGAERLAYTTFEIPLHLLFMPVTGLPKFDSSHLFFVVVLSFLFVCVFVFGLGVVLKQDFIIPRMASSS